MLTAVLFRIVVILNLTSFYGRAVSTVKILLSWPVFVARLNHAEATATGFNDSCVIMSDNHPKDKKELTISEEELQRLVEKYGREMLASTVPQIINATLLSMGINPEAEKKIDIQQDMHFLRSWRKKIDRVIDVATSTFVSWFVKSLLGVLAAGAVYLVAKFFIG